MNATIYRLIDAGNNVLCEGTREECLAHADEVDAEFPNRYELRVVEVEAADHAAS